MVCPYGPGLAGLLWSGWAAMVRLLWSGCAILELFESGLPELNLGWVGRT